MAAIASDTSQIPRWFFPTLAAYDRYEGVAAGVYQRTLMKVTMADGTTLEAWVYLAGEKLLAQSASFIAISGGDWFER